MSEPTPMGETHSTTNQQPETGDPEKKRKNEGGDEALHQKKQRTTKREQMTLIYITCIGQTDSVIKYVKIPSSHLRHRDTRLLQLVAKEREFGPFGTGVIMKNEDYTEEDTKENVKKWKVEFVKGVLSAIYAVTVGDPVPQNSKWSGKCTGWKVVNENTNPVTASDDVRCMFNLKLKCIYKSY